MSNLIELQTKAMEVHTLLPDILDVISSLLTHDHVRPEQRDAERAAARLLYNKLKELR